MGHAHYSEDHLYGMTDTFACIMLNTLIVYR